MIPGVAGAQGLHLYRFLAEYPWYVASGPGATITDVDGTELHRPDGLVRTEPPRSPSPARGAAAARQRSLGDSVGAYTAGGGRAGRAPLLPVRTRRLGLRRARTVPTRRATPSAWPGWRRVAPGCSSPRPRTTRPTTGARSSRPVCPSRTAASPRPSSTTTPTASAHAVDAADGDLAAIMITPFHQGYFQTPLLPTAPFLDGGPRRSPSLGRGRRARRRARRHAHAPQRRVPRRDRSRPRSGLLRQGPRQRSGARGLRRFGRSARRGGSCRLPRHVLRQRGGAGRVRWPRSAPSTPRGRSSG